METPAALDALSALAQEARLAVFRALVKAGAEGMSAGDISEQVGVPSSTLSSHLNILAHAGLVSRRRESRSVIYAADYGSMNALLRFLTEDCCQGHPAVCGPLLKSLEQASCCEPAPGAIQ
jgi:DNA-binding transcriptional ArsR family regulator